MKGLQSPPRGGEASEKCSYVHNDPGLPGQLAKEAEKRRPRNKWEREGSLNKEERRNGGRQGGFGKEKEKEEKGELGK